MRAESEESPARPEEGRKVALFCTTQSLEKWTQAGLGTTGPFLS